MVRHERYRRFKGLDSRSASRAQATAYVAVKPALSGDVWLVHRLFRRLCHAGENPVSRVDILKLAFFGPFIGALARSFGGIISDRLGGVRVTLVNFVLMALFTGLLFLTLPGSGSGSFLAFYVVFMGLF